MDPVTLRKKLISRGLESYLLKIWSNESSKSFRGCYGGNRFVIHEVKDCILSLTSQDYVKSLVKSVAFYADEKGKGPHITYRYKDGSFGADWIKQGINLRERKLKKDKKIRKESIVRLRDNGY